MLLYKSVIRPLMFCLPPETAHGITMFLMRWTRRLGLLRLLTGNAWKPDRPDLVREVFGLQFKNPIGLAAGFDKEGAFVREFAAIGFGFIEVGTLTPRSQPGNPRPRLFRLPPDRALINRMGFNNDGVDRAVRRLKNRPRGIIVGGNIGKNRDTDIANAAEDYLRCFEALFDSVDYFAVNVSSPNTPGLRSLQEKEPLQNILSALQQRNYARSNPKPILLKIAPDLGPGQLDDIVEIVLQTRIAGVIAANTTVSRDGLRSAAKRIEAAGAGGLSGAPMRDRSTGVIRYLREKLGPDIPIIGVGGILSPEEALEKLKAGASLVQVYTGLVYEGPALIRRIARALPSEGRVAAASGNVGG
jgi:dihydroorotate dehydrogenase